MPAFEPPFDDEVDPQVWAMAHQLAFDWGRLATTDGKPNPRHQGTAGADTAAPGTAGAAGAAAAGAAAGTAAPGTTAPGSAAPGTTAPGTTAPGTTAAVTGAAVAGASAEARLAVRRFVSVCVEVLNGYRPAAHLRPLSVPGNAAGVVAQAVAATHRVAELRRASGRTLRGASRHGRRPDPVVVRSLRLCEPRPGAVEAAVLLITGERTWAVALRLERHHQSWSATTLRLI